MDREGFPLGITLDERIGSQRFEGLVEAKGIGGDRGKERAEMCGSLGEQLFRDGVRGEEGAQAQQVGRGGLGLLDALEGERPGGRNGFGMIGYLSAPLTEQVGSMLLVEL